MRMGRGPCLHRDPRLLPCPFCGAEALHYKYGHTHFVECSRCAAQMGRAQDRGGKRELYAMWNRRERADSA